MNAHDGSMNRKIVRDRRILRLIDRSIELIWMYYLSFRLTDWLHDDTRILSTNQTHHDDQLRWILFCPLVDGMTWTVPVFCLFDYFSLHSSMQVRVPICDRVSPSWIALLRFCRDWCLLDEVLRYFDHAPLDGISGVRANGEYDSYYGTLD